MKGGIKLVFGVGINNSDYPISQYEKVNGKLKQVWMCPIYLCWREMLCRCYSEIYQIKKPSYVGCSTVPEWHYFMTFRAWMLEQDWEGKQLDKDLLVNGNKVYGPDTCVFVDSMVNNFILERKNGSGEWPIGVSFKKERNKFVAQCSELLNNKYRHLGYFDSPEEAHKAWLTFKLEQAKLLASLQKDQKLAVALVKRYENYGK